MTVWRCHCPLLLVNHGGTPISISQSGGPGHHNCAKTSYLEMAQDPGVPGSKLGKVGTNSTLLFVPLPSPFPGQFTSILNLSYKYILTQP